MRIKGFVVVLLLTVTACTGDVVNEYYATRKDAEHYLLFERGWLPELIPQSAFDISLSNDLDVNTSAGMFRFSPSEYEFISGLIPACGSTTDLPADMEHHYRKYVDAGYLVLRYQEKTSTWHFVCNGKQGVCLYRLMTGVTDPAEATT